MPPRRRKAAAASSSTAAAAAAPVAKKPKTSLSLSWEWEDDGETWTAFSEDMLQKINDSYDQDEMKVEMTVNKVKFNILLDKMVQKNAKTGWERRIRCLVKDASDYYVWQWQDEKKRWNPYTANDTITIEMSYQAGEESVGIVAFHRSYTIDLKKMDQLNDVTKVTRTVERIKVDHKPAKADKASVSESNGSVSASAEKTSGKKSQKTKRKVKEEKVDDDDDDDNDGDVKPSTSKSEAKNIKTVVMKGKAPVDPECHAKVGKAEVFWEGNDIYDVMLNQTNLMNNNNKYYLIQLLKDEGKNVFSVWQRWGRVGKAGQSNLVACGPDLDEAKKVFMKKFRDKTLNDWANRHSFTKVQGKYDIVEMDYSAKDDVTETDSKSKAKKKETTIPDSKLDKRLQTLVEMICNVKAMEDTVIEMKYDAKKAPLGKLTDDQIKAGLGALKEIEHCIKNNIIGNRLIQACDAYYTRIPHDFGMKRPPVIRSEDDLQREIDLLEALGDIQIAMNIIKSETGEIANPIDRHYSAMKCQLNPLEKTDPEFKLVCDYVKNTHAITHNQYKMEVLDVFAVDKDKEQELFKDYGNRMLLWHGSRLTNYMGILSKGLRIAPPEAPVTGYMFGKGVYFADMSSKSANYCFATKSKDVGLCLLSEVSLGTANELLNADYKADKLPAGKHSVKGLGRIAPDPSKNHTTSDGTVVPLGKGINTGVTNPQGYTLNYNEYIVYNTNQIKMRYLVKIKFHFK